MRKLLRANTFIGLSLLAILAVASTMQMPLAHAASISTDPLVDIVVDATSPSCFFVWAHGVSPQAATKTRISCAPYTQVKTVSMLRSRAIALQEPYMLHPNANATQAEWQAYASRFHQIAKSKRIAHRVSASAQAGTPVPACSAYWNETTAWPTIDGDELKLSISWYSHEGSSCNQIYLQTSVVQGYTSPNPVYIGIESYQGGFLAPTWEPWKFIGTNTVTHGWGGYLYPQPNGGDFYEDFGPSGCCRVDASYDLGYLY